MRFLMSPKTLPTVILLIQLGSAVVCAFNGDWRRTIYWLGACVIVASVTY